MALPLISILIAGATAAIGYFFQENSARNARRRQNEDAELERKRQLREAELSRAQEIFSETSSAMDVLYYLLEGHAMHIAVRKAQDDSSQIKEDGENWDKVEDAVMNWMSHKTRFATQMQQYFGDENHKRLNKIHESFTEAWSLVESTYYKKTKSIVKDSGKENGEKKVSYVKYYKIVGYPRKTPPKLESDIMTLCDQMIRDIQKQNVGILRK